MNEYNITIRSDRPPQIFLGQTIAGGKVISLVSSEPDTVDVAWLHKRYPTLSAHTIRKKLESIKMGTSGKFLYDRISACELLSETPKKRGRKRKN